MKLSTKNKAILKSYARGVLTAIAPLISTGNRDKWAYLAAIVAGVIAPAIRAWDKTDPVFGVVADELVKVSETKVKAKVAKADKTK